MPIPDFLTEEQIEAPIGVGFGPMSLIARWLGNVYFSIYTGIEFPQEEYDWKEIRETKAGMFWYYFESKAKAKIAYDETGDDKGPSTTWMWQAKADSVLNWRGDRSIEEVFNSPTVWREAAFRGLSKAAHKSRHELHMISLPAAVAAMADAWGYDNPGFSLSELMRAEDEILWTDSFQLDMIGNKDIGFADSILWKRRKELWSALGETDASKWQPIGSGVANGKYDTTSEKLHKCLQILHSPWKAPIWSRVTFVWDPRRDALMGSGQRLTRPVLEKIFSSRAEAQAAASEEIGTEGETPSTAPSGEPTLPSGYGEFHDAWVEEVQKLKEKHDGKMPPPPRLAEDLKFLAVGYDDVKAWWDKV